MKVSKSKTKKRRQLAGPVPKPHVRRDKKARSVAKFKVSKDPIPEPVGGTDGIPLLPGSIFISGTATLTLDPTVALEFTVAIDHEFPPDYLELSVDGDLLRSIFKNMKIEIQYCGAGCETKVAYDHLEKKLYMPTMPILNAPGKLWQQAAYAPSAGTMNNSAE